jgi:hypothetical protein
MHKYYIKKSINTYAQIVKKRMVLYIDIESSEYIQLLKMWQRDKLWLPLPP